MIYRALAPVIAAESIYSVVLMAICLAIYFKTEEMERLSMHKGINYFRKTFLFFAASYFFKFITRALLFGFAAGGPMPMRGMHNINTIQWLSTGIFSISIYASVIASFYLIYSISWKNGKARYFEVFWHIIALLIGIVTVFFSSSIVFIASQLSLFFYGIFKMLTKKKKSGLFIIYSLLLIIWALSIVEIFIPDFLIQTQILLYIASTGLFSLILYKVNKSTQV